MDWMCGERKGEKVKERQGQEKGHGWPQSFGLKWRGGIGINSDGQDCRRNMFVTEDEFKFWTWPISLRASCFLHPISKFWDSSRLSSPPSFPILNDLIYSYGFQYHLDIQSLNLNLQSRFFTWIPDCLLDISTRVFERHLKLNTSPNFSSFPLTFP